MCCKSGSRRLVVQHGGAGAGTIDRALGGLGFGSGRW